MTKFKTAVLKLLKENLPRSYDYWRTTNPSYENEDYDEYVEDVLNKCFEKYAIFIKKDPKYGKLFLSKGIDLENYDAYFLENELAKIDGEFVNVFDTEEEAKQIAEEYLANNPGETYKIEKAYNEDPDQNVEWYTADDVEYIQSYEDWEEDKYNSRADYEYESKYKYRD